jgi:death-on-curing protein
VFRDTPEYGSLDEPRGVRDQNLLESAVNQPYQMFADRELYPTLYDKAACLWALVIRNHPFIQANKRTATLAMLVFLGMNGRRVQSSVENFIEFSLAIVSDKSISINDVANWLRRRARQIDGQSS